MAAVPDLTKAEVSAMITDPILKTWWDSASEYDASFGTTEAMQKLLTACFRAQVAKNTAANAIAPLQVGESLNSFAAPVNTVPVLDLPTGLQLYTQTITVSGVTSTTSDAMTPSVA